MHHTDEYSQHSSIIWSPWPNGWLFVCKLNGCGLESRLVTKGSDISPVSSKKLLDSQAITECRFTLKRKWHDSIYIQFTM